MQKNFVLDTNVLLHDADAITAFEDNNVIIPIYVLEEVDTFKKDLSELGRNARHVSRKLDDLELVDPRTGKPVPAPRTGERVLLVDFVARVRTIVREGR